MRIWVNEREREIEEPIHYDDLLSRICDRPEHVALAVNGEFIPRGMRSQTAVRAGDRVEILVPHGGG